jgi:hypothetical protein
MGIGIGTAKQVHFMNLCVSLDWPIAGTTAVEMKKSSIQ